MTTTVVPVAVAPERRARLDWPSLIETFLALAAIGALLPLFAAFAHEPAGRDARFASVVAVAGAESGTVVTNAKNEATRALLESAGSQWAAAMLAGLALLKLSRTGLRPTLGVALALLLAALAAWAGRVPWPLAPDRAFEPGRVAVEWTAAPADFVVALVVAACALLFASPWIRPAARVPQTLASRFGYPGFVVATGVGSLILLDLSANGPPSNRYLALYHQGHLWLAMLVLGGLTFVRQSLGRALSTLFAIVDELGARVRERVGTRTLATVLAVATIVAVALTGTLLSGLRQFTSELGRVWLVVGVAWFFFLRGGAMAQRLATRGTSLVSLVRYAWPLAFVCLVLVAMMLATRDMGPLLIASYAGGAFLAATIAMWWHVRTGAIAWPAVVAIGGFAAWIVGVTFALLEFGAIEEVTAGRLENLAAPLASANDQLALVSWFREAAPERGFGLGAVPWCGYAGSASCAGVPAQIQSDYTFTALVGAFGGTAAWAFSIGVALWLHRVVRHHGRVTRGEPAWLRMPGRIVVDAQAFISWIGVIWVVLTLCQLAVTVAGNLAVVPLTGVTFPFVSFGMTSLVVNTAFLALCLNVDRPERALG